MIKGLPTPNKKYYSGQWQILIYNGTQTALCMRQDGKIFMVKPNTEQIKRLPQYVQEKLWQIGFLTEWREEQIRRTAIRLKDLSTKHERFLRIQKRHQKP